MDVKDKIEKYTKKAPIGKKLNVDEILNQEGETLLYCAARDGGVQAVDHLLNLGADVSLGCGKSKRTPLYVAVKNGHREVFEVLLLGRRYQGDLRSPSSVLRKEHMSKKFDSTSLLYRAAERGYLDVCRTILDNGAPGIDRAKFGVGGVTPLMIAARNGMYDCVKVLLKYGADANVSAAGRTALYEAASAGYADICELLLKSGSDINIEVKDKNGSKHTALSIAAVKGRTKVVMFLQRYVGDRGGGGGGGVRKNGSFASRDSDGKGGGRDTGSDESQGCCVVM